MIVAVMAVSTANHLMAAAAFPKLLLNQATMATSPVSIMNFKSRGAIHLTTNGTIIRSPFVVTAIQYIPGDGFES